MFDRVEADVVTLDIQMPKMDGLATLDAILARRPVPVITVSSLTRRGAEIMLEALDRGAMDYVAKPASGAEADAALGRELLRKIRMVAGLQVGRIIEIRKQRKQHRAGVLPVSGPGIAADAASNEFADKCIALGISTGGPPALAALFESLRPPCPPIVVVQHMPPQFTRSLAWWLDSRSQLTIREAGNGELLRPDHVYIAPGGAHLELHGIAPPAAVRVFDAPAVSGHKPSIDVMMRSAARIYRAKCLGIIMTGMGHDGVDGCRAIRQAGGFVLGQDEASSDIYGMNKAAFAGGESIGNSRSQKRPPSSRAPCGDCGCLKLLRFDRRANRPR